MYIPLDFHSKYPRDLDQSIQIILSQLNSRVFTYIKNNGIYTIQLELSPHIINEWNLWGLYTSPIELREYFMSTYQLGYADDMSGMIFFGLDKIINTGIFTNSDAEIKASKYREYWINRQVHPKYLYEIKEDNINVSNSS